MKNLIKILRVFYWVCVAITAATLYGIVTRGIEWIPFAAIAWFMAYYLRKECNEMQDDINSALQLAVNEIWDTCKGSDSGEYSIEYLHNGNWYFITIDYYVTYIETIGAEFMGQYERLSEKDIEEIVIKDFECRSDCTDEIVDCGFTIDELQEAI